MKTLLKLLAGLLIALNAGYVFAQSVEDDLVGLGMKPEIANYLSGILPGGAVLDNNTFLKGRNAADSADISILKVDGSDETYLNADSGDSIVLSVATTPVAQLNASGFYVAPFAADATFIAGTAPRLAVTNVTPASGTPTPTSHSLKIGYNLIISGSANQSNVLPTPVSSGLGQMLYVANASGSDKRIFPGDANDQINAGGTGKYTVVGDKQEMRCHSVGSSAWRCHMLSAIPTPA